MVSIPIIKRCAYCPTNRRHIGPCWCPLLTAPRRSTTLYDTLEIPLVLRSLEFCAMACHPKPVHTFVTTPHSSHASFVSLNLIQNTAQRRGRKIYQKLTGNVKRNTCMHNGGVPCTCCITGAVVYITSRARFRYQAYNQGRLDICPAVEWGYSLRHMTRCLTDHVQ